MPAKDVYHNTVKVALQKEGWLITYDPLVLELSSGRMEIDLGAEQLIAAQKDNIQIVVEIKSFLSPFYNIRILSRFRIVSELSSCIKSQRSKSSSFFSSQSVS
jgi:XisH protein